MHCINDYFDNSTASFLFGAPDMEDNPNSEYVFYVQSKPSIYHCKDTYLDISVC